MKWENKKDVSQRDYVIEILNMQDFHKNKNKNISNIQGKDIEIKSGFKDILIKPNIKNTEELDVDIDFV